MTYDNGAGHWAEASAHPDRLASLTCFKWSHFDEDVLPAWVADMDFAPAPVAVDAVRALVDRGDFGYNGAALARIPDAFAQWQRERHGWEPDPARVRVVCDVMQAVETALWIHTDPGDGVVLFTPVYPPFFSAIESTGRRVVECPLVPGTWELDPAALESAIDERTRVILTCDPHNPTGRVFTRSELETIERVACQHDLLVISDEIWADIVHEGAVHIPFAALSDDAAARTVTVTAASKAFNLAGLRCAVMHLGHEGVREHIGRLPSHLLGAVGSPGAEATLAAWREGGPWLERTTRFLTEQRDHLCTRLAAELPEAAFSVPEATYLLWVDLRAYRLAEEPWALLLERGRVALGNGPDFGARGQGFVRINFATSRSILDAIVDRIVATVLAHRAVE